MTTDQPKPSDSAPCLMCGERHYSAVCPSVLAKIDRETGTPVEADDSECEFCEIDGGGNHAPRCPVSLERELSQSRAEIAKLQALLVHPCAHPHDVSRFPPDGTDCPFCELAEARAERDAKSRRICVLSSGCDQLQQDNDLLLELVREEIYYKQLHGYPTNDGSWLTRAIAISATIVPAVKKQGSEG